MRDRMKITGAAAAVSAMLIFTLTACANAQSGAASTATSENAQSAAASSEVTVAKNPWFDEEAYYERLEAAGIPTKLNDDGSMPAEWTPEFYEGEEYADCDGITTGPDGYVLDSLSTFAMLNDNLDYIHWDKLNFGDDFPEEMLWAMSTADFKRAAPGIEPPTIEDVKRFKEDAQKYLESRGAGEYPIHFLGYIADIINRPNETPESIRVTFAFINEQVEAVGDIMDVGTFYCLYSVKDYSNQGYREFKEGIDTAYGAGTYEKLHEELVGDLVDDARSRTQAE